MLDHRPGRPGGLVGREAPRECGSGLIVEHAFPASDDSDLVGFADNVFAGRVTGRAIATAPGAHPGRDWDTADWVADPSAAHRLLGWAPTVDLAEGLARTWAAS